MTDAAWASQSEYGRLRADYDAAFARMCAEQPSPRVNGEAAADLRFYEALSSYRECRERLARFLVSSGSAGTS